MAAKTARPSLPGTAQVYPDSRLRKAMEGYGRIFAPTGTPHPSARLPPTLAARGPYVQFSYGSDWVALRVSVIANRDLSRH